MGRRPPGDVVMLSWPTVLVTRVIWAAMLTGQVAAVVVGAVTLANGGGGAKPQVAAPPVLAVAGVVTLVGIVLAIVVRRRRLSPAADVRLVQKQHTGRVIVSMAILEGAGFVGLAVVFLSGQWWPAAAGPAAAILVAAWLYPPRLVRVG